ncbi:hypothetical protein SKA18_13855 [Enterococcus faecium]
MEARPPGTLEEVRERPFGYPEGVRVSGVRVAVASCHAVQRPSQTGNS